MASLSQLRASILEHGYRMLLFGAMVGVVTLHIAVTSPATAAPNRLSTAQVEQLVSPIALYPDGVLAQILMAATFPVEVVQAARWSRANPDLTGKELEDAMAMQMWDPVVKALTTAPHVLQMMDEKLEWTQQLGDAFLAQQDDMLKAIQALRQRADAMGSLRNTAQQRVTKTTRPTGGRNAALAQVITIEPTNPEVIYAPIYDPAVVYGPWPYADHVPPFYWSPPNYVAADVIGFDTGFVASPIWANVDWRRNKMFVNVNRYNMFNRTRITSADVAQRFGASRAAGDAGSRRDGTARKGEGARGVAKGGQRIASRGDRPPQRQGGSQRTRPNEAARNRAGLGPRLAARPRSGPGFGPGGDGRRVFGTGAGPRFAGIGAGPRFLRSGVSPRFGGFGGGPFAAGGGFRLGGGGGGHFGGGGFRRR